MESDHLTELVRRALDHFDEQPLGTSTRRAYRIARLIGDVAVAHRLQLELRPSATVHDRITAVMSARDSKHGRRCWRRATRRHRGRSGSDPAQMGRSGAPAEFEVP